MLKNTSFTNEEILEQVKLSCKIPEIINEIITRKIIEKAVLDADITVKDEELQQAADQMRLLNRLISVEDTYKWLQKYNLSLDDFEKIAQNTLFATKLANHLFADKIEPYFFENQLNYTGAVLYEIVLNDEDLALELFYAIKEGETTFNDAASKYIQDNELRRKGGYRGIMQRKDLKAEISAVVFAAKPPQLLKPIVTSKGVHLIFVEEIIQPQLDDKIRYQILSELFENWVDQQKSDLSLFTH